MNEAKITQYLIETFPAVAVVTGSKEAGSPEVSWGDTFFFYDPERKPADERRFPFATIVTKDYPDFDCASSLDRSGVFRLNIGISRETYRTLFGTSENKISSYDFTELDRVMPHPVYGKMFWVCVLNPGSNTSETKVGPLLAEAYNLAAQRYKGPTANQS